MCVCTGEKTDHLIVGWWRKWELKVEGDGREGLAIEVRVLCEKERSGRVT